MDYDNSLVRTWSSYILTMYADALRRDENARCTWRGVAADAAVGEGADA